MVRYLNLLELTRSGIGEADNIELPPELELQALWFAGAFGRDFYDTAGQPVHIKQFGQWNRTSGPDFVHTVVEIAGNPHHGALELDREQEDWERHGHGVDPAFDQVVLHVVFRDSAQTSFTRTSAHKSVPRVVISREQLVEALQQPRHQVAIAHPGRCVQPLADMPDAAVESLLQEAAEYRAHQKSKRFQMTAEAHGRDAALFQATAETLGYRANQLPMRVLSQKAPLSSLLKSADAAPALLFGVSGFLSPELHEKAPEDTREYLRSLWDTWWKHRAEWEPYQEIPWKMHGQRPANHPHRRVAALACLVRHWHSYRNRALARPFSITKLTDFLTELDDPFWSHRHTLSSANSEKNIALFGKSKATELLINHLIPLVIQEDPEFTWSGYLAIRASGTNEKVRRCAIRLFGSEEKAKPWIKKAAWQQALLQIYHDFCLEDVTDCANCPFPEQLSQWR